MDGVESSTREKWVGSRRVLVGTHLDVSAAGTRPLHPIRLRPNPRIRPCVPTTPNYSALTTRASAGRSGPR